MQSTLPSHCNLSNHSVSFLHCPVWDHSNTPPWSLFFSSDRTAKLTLRRTKCCLCAFCRPGGITEIHTSVGASTHLSVPSNLFCGSLHLILSRPFFFSTSGLLFIPLHRAPSSWQRLILLWFQVIYKLLECSSPDALSP